jgi:hypothetical protein
MPEEPVTADLDFTPESPMCLTFRAAVSDPCAEHPEFHNIHYVQEMLRQVFTALDRAQRETGFFHADMGMRNVMEHYPE